MSSISFPNNAKVSNAVIEAVEFSLELSSEVPGTSADWPSDITAAINGVEIATWTSPGDYGDKRGVYTPGWWKLRGSQYGKLKTWRVNGDGTFVDGLEAVRACGWGSSISTSTGRSGFASG